MIALGRKVPGEDRAVYLTRTIFDLLIVLGLLLVSISIAFARDAEPNRKNWPQAMTIATASPGGTYAIYGAGIAQLIRDVVKVPTTTEATQGASQNLVLIQNRKVDISLTTLGPTWEAWNGQLDINTGIKHRDVRALFPMYESPFHIVSLQKPSKNITSIHDLDGKVIGIGPASSTAAKYFPNLFRQIGLRVALNTGAYMRMSMELTAGRIDALTFASGPPNPTIVDLESAQKLNIFSFNAEELRQILTESPFLSPFTISQDTYRSLTAPQETVAMWNFAIVNRAMPDDLAFEIVKAVMNNYRALEKIHPSAIDTAVENIEANRFLWLHPGAIRYYRSVHVKVPYNLIPPETQVD
jgi:hypothetical protein